MRPPHSMAAGALLVLAALAPASVGPTAETAGKPVAGPIKLVSFPIPVHVESASQGLMIELTRAVAAEAGLSLSITVLPPLRAVAGFKAGRFHGLFPALYAMFPPTRPPLRTSESMDCKQDFVFTKKGRPPLRSYADLAGKRVGYTLGYPYDAQLFESPAWTLESGRSDEMNIRKLMADQLDAFVLDEKTGRASFKALGMEEAMQYDPSQPLAKQDVFYAFQADRQGAAWALQFSSALARLKADGRFQQITRGITFVQGCRG